MKCGTSVCEDYEHVRHGTCTLFVAIEAGAGERTVTATARRIQSAASRSLKRVQFHYTSKHASWRNMAEIEIGVPIHQRQTRRFADRDVLASEVAA